ncbi:MAG: phosphocholine cytidylyltransferase family protein [Candidatus Hodarchaeales archaeon]
MDIIILSAGKGERLLPLTRHTPKCLLEINQGITLLESQLLCISKIEGINKIYLVVGYLAEQIESKLPSYLKDIKLDVTTIYNPFYDISNNFITLWCALPFMSDDFAIINGDDVFHWSVLDQLRKAEDKKICMVIDRKDEYEIEDMKVRIKGSNIKAVSKEIPLERTNGESIGMIRFKKQGADQLKNSIHDLVRKPQSKKIFWLAAVQDLIDRGYEVKYIEIPRDKWAEVDFHPDLTHVRDQVFQYIPKSIFHDYNNKK